MLIINQNQVKKLLPLKDIKKVISAVEKGFFDYAQKKVQMPSKIYLDFPKYQGDLRIMPAFSEEIDLAGTKLVNVHPNNRQKKLFTVMATIVLNDPSNGLPLSLMDGTYITGLRTGAAGAVAVKYLARQNASRLGIIGAGQQAIFQIAAILKVRQIKQILVYDIFEKNISKLAKTLKKEKIIIQPAKTIKHACEVDILVTTTPSRKPIIKKEWILDGVHINAIGADAAGKQELDSKILQKGKIVIDDWAQASHSGEINVPLSQGVLKKSDIFASLPEIAADQKLGRQNEKEITIFDSTGLAIQDLYTANLVYQSAKRKKIGKEIKII